MSLFENFTPEARLLMGAGIMGGQNLGQGVSQGAQMAAPIMMANKQAAEQKIVENQTRSWLQQQYPGEDFNTMSPDMMKTYVNQAIQKRFAKPEKPKFEVINGKIVKIDPTTGESSLIGDYSDPKEPKHSADYQVYQDEVADPGFKAQREAERALKDAPTTKDKMDAEMDTRKTYRAEPNVKAYQTVKTAYQKGRQAAQMDSAAGDMSLVYAFMKMQDPESVVREGEYATAEKAGSAQDWVVNIYNRVRTGQRLTAQQKADFVKAMDEQYTIASGSLEDTNKQYEPYIDEFGLPKERLITQPEKFEPLDLKTLGDGQTVTTKDKSGNPVTIQKLPEQ